MLLVNQCRAEDPDAKLEWESVGLRKSGLKPRSLFNCQVVPLRFRGRMCG